MDVLASPFAIGLDGLVRDHKEPSLAKRQRRVRVRVTSGAIGPGQRADQVERAVTLDRVHHHAGVEVTTVRPAPMNDDVMGAEIAVQSEALAVAVVLAWPPPARGETRTRRIREIDDDEDAVPVAAFPRGRVCVPAAGEPDPVHPESFDRQESDPSGVGGSVDVIHDKTRAFGHADAVWVLLVVREEESLGELDLVLCVPFGTGI